MLSLSEVINVRKGSSVLNSTDRNALKMYKKTVKSLKNAPLKEVEAAGLGSLSSTQSSILFYTDPNGVPWSASYIIFITIILKICLEIK